MGDMAEYYGNDDFLDLDNEDDELDDDEFMEWKTRDGRLMNIKDMEDAHLTNTIRFLAARGAAVNLAVLRGTATPLEQTEATLNPRSWELVKTYANMLKEQERRKNRASIPEAAQPATSHGSGETG